MAPETPRRGDDVFAPIADNYNSWYQTRTGHIAAELENELFKRLVRPVAGQTLLEVGCGTGHNLASFNNLGMKTTGLDSSAPMLRIAASTVPEHIVLIQGDASQLPFPDRTFDIVALITVLEFVADPLAVISEAARVCRAHLYCGVLNAASFLGLQRRMVAVFRTSTYRHATFFTVGRLEALLRAALGQVPFHWASTLVLPLSWQGRVHDIERILSFKRNRFGGFLGVHIPCQE
jgi:ubiquinone/menaquinone biosynthesis C-methylase UbiE